MSYILDALKKSEKERQRGTLPDMLTVQDIVSEKPARLSWVYLIVVALLLNAGVLVWWLGFSHSDKTTIVRTSKTDNAPHLSVNDTAQPDPERIKLPHDYTLSSSPANGPVEKNIAPAIEKTVTINPEGNPAIQNVVPMLSDIKTKVLPDISGSDRVIEKSSGPSPLKAEQGTEQGSLPSKAKSAVAEIPDENKLYKLNELPSAISQSLPVFSVSALLYSGNPASRMVRVNDQMMHEGQDLDTGLKLDEITRDGLVFRYKKYRFYVEAK